MISKIKKIIKDKIGDKNIDKKNPPSNSDKDDKMSDFVILSENSQIVSKGKINNENTNDISDILLSKDNNIQDSQRWRSISKIFSFRIVWIFCVYIWYILFDSISVVYMIITALIFSVAIDSMIVFFSKFFGRSRSIMISYLIFLLIVFFWFLVFGVFLIEQFRIVLWFFVSWFDSINDNLNIIYITNRIQSLSIIPDSVKSEIISYISSGNYIEQMQKWLQTNISNLTNIIQSSTSGVYTIWFGAIYNTIWFIWNFSIVFVLSILFSIEKDLVVSFFSKIAWRENQKYRNMKINKIYVKMWDWLKWQILLCFIIWIVVFVSLWIVSLFGIKLPNIVSISFIAWITEFIPYLWPILGAVPALLVASINYWLLWFLIVLWIFLIIQQLENNVLVPMVMKKTLWISSSLVFISMIIWWVTIWILGVLLAIPFAVIISILYEKE